MKIERSHPLCAISVKLIVLVLAAVATGYLLRHMKTRSADLAGNRSIQPSRDEPSRFNHPSATVLPAESGKLRLDAPSAAERISASSGFSEVSFESEEEDFEGLVSGWPVAQVRARLEQLHAQEPLFSEQQEILIRRWAMTDPAGAIHWSDALRSKADRQAGYRQLALGWSQTDARSAADWVENWPANNAKFSVLLELAYEAAASEPISAIELAGRLPRNGARDALLTHAMSQWAAMDSAAATEWAKNIQDADLRERFISAIAVATAERDGSAAATMIVTDLAPGEALNRAAVSVLQRWMQTDYENAFAWINAFPESDVKENSLGALVSLNPPLP